MHTQRSGQDCRSAPEGVSSYLVMACQGVLVHHVLCVTCFEGRSQLQRHLPACDAPSQLPMPMSWRSNVEVKGGTDTSCVALFRCVVEYQRMRNAGSCTPAGSAPFRFCVASQTEHWPPSPSLYSTSYRPSGASFMLQLVWLAMRTRSDGAQNAQRWLHALFLKANACMICMALQSACTAEYLC